MTIADGLRAAKPLAFEALAGWPGDDQAAALRCFNSTRKLCDLLSGWQPRQTDEQNARRFFEEHFQPVELKGTSDVLFTGYYEPEIAGARRPSELFSVPLYRAPPEVSDHSPWATRSDIETLGLLEGRGLEIAWIAHEIDRFFLQVQGSGRIRLTDGTVLRLGFGGRNGHPYRSIGQELVARGIILQEAVSAEKIRAYAVSDPAAGRALMQHNPSYVFFRVVPELPSDHGPIGTLGAPVTAMRSLAVDPQCVPLGSPVWIETEGPSPMRRLMIAQDTGSAIKGPSRADIFVGTGQDAGSIAGSLRDPGRMVVFLPRSSWAVDGEDC